MTGVRGPGSRQRRELGPMLDIGMTSCMWTVFVTEHGYSTFEASPLNLL